MPRGYGSGPGVEVPIPADQRKYYLRGYTVTRLHGRGRHHAAKPKKPKKPKRIHGRGRHADPWKHKGIGPGQ